MPKNIILSIFLLPTFCLTASASNICIRQDGTKKPASDTAIIFHFAKARKMFFKDYKANNESINKAERLIKQHIKAIRAGKAIITIEGFCTSFKTEISNLKMAKNRSNQVKSYYITHLRLKETNYRTRNHTHPYKEYKNIVALLKIDYLQQKFQTDSSHTTVSISPTIENKDTVTTTHTTPPLKNDTTVSVKQSVTVGEKLHHDWIVKTNLPFWGLVVPNLAVEYGFREHWSVEIPVYYMPITVSREYRFRIFAVQPSLRYWLKPQQKGHFFGFHLTTGLFNISTNDKTRYQDKHGMYGAGLDYGYSFSLNNRWGLELNAGAGYIYTRYNKYYNIDNGAYYGSGTKNYWGLTRLGISITYLLNKNGK